MEFSVKDKYRLEIHWSKVVYKQEGEVELEGCSLCGPVLKEVSEMNKQDSMDLDFANQYIVLMQNYYIVKFSWGWVDHTPERIYLKDVSLKNKYTNSVPKLEDDDYIVVDTENHEDEKHQVYLTYPSYLVKSSGDLKIFRS